MTDQPYHKMEPYETKHLIIFDEGIQEGRKTIAWTVWNKHDDIYLGSIEWHTGFRKYSFYPVPDRVFEWVCLRDIAQFTQDRTEEHLFAKKVEWRWWNRSDPELGLSGFLTKMDRDNFSAGKDGPFRRVVSKTGDTHLQGESFPGMVSRLAHDAGIDRK